MASDPRRRTRPTTRVTPVDGPPQLDFKLVQRLKILLLANVIPVVGGAAVLVSWLNGSIEFDPKAGKGLAPLLVLAGACLVLLLSMWVLLPFGAWLRAYPRWHYQRGPRLVWAAPSALGWLAWAGCWVIGCAAGLGALFLVGMSLVRLYQLWA